MVLKQTHSYYDYRSDSTIYTLYILGEDGNIGLYSLKYHEGSTLTTEDYTMSLMAKVKRDPDFNAVELDEQHLILASGLKITVLNAKNLSLVKETSLTQLSPNVSEI